MIASLSPISVFSTVRLARPEVSPSSRDAEADGATSRAEQDGKSERSEPAAQIRGQGPGQLSEADQQRLRALQQRDREVRVHEMAHVAAGGSLIIKDGKPIGSALIGQNFTDPKYFWGRPSATAPQPYNAAASSGSNQGPLTSCRMYSFG